ncbi:MAG: shikimate dehydrogenase [Clostridia bacterium]|nr:shikimate dehydrogenase [Clostridia bacterium]
MQYGCIGEKLSHSYSKDIHNKIGRYDYELCEVSRDGFDLFMQKRDFLGINVTIPYKQSVIPYLYEIEENAQKIGAVNTVINKNGKLYGYNTDFSGMKAMIEKAGIPLKSKKVLILGSGGTSKTANAVAQALGASEIIKVSRTGNDGAVTYKECIDSHAYADIIINTTPCGMYPENDQSPIDISRFKRLSGVVDVIYNPLRSRLILDAEMLKIPCTGGLYMLVSQAVFAAEHFTGNKFDFTDKIFDELIKKKENIVLTGMPASGKTTIGKMLAQYTGRAFIDTDEEIVKKAGMTIPDIFAKHGEEYFRDLETETAKDIGKRCSLVIATGGGIVLRQKNIDALKQNGKIYFIDRHLESLVPTDDRPLSQTPEAIKKRYEERYHLYLSTSDHTVKISDNIAENAQKINKLHFG